MTVARFRRAIGILLVGVLAVWTVAACSGGSSADLSPPVRLNAGQIIDEAIAADTSSSYRRLRSVLVTVDGNPVAQRYYGSGSPTTAWDIESAGKTIVGTLIGIALGEKKISSLDATLRELLPDARRWMSKADAGITLRQLLTMTAGLPDDDVYYPDVVDQDHLDRDWVREALRVKPSQAPGEGFVYSSAGSHLLSAVLVQATGRSVLDYAREKLFDPLGIRTRPAAEPAPADADLREVYTAARFAWPTDPQGRHIGGGGLKMTAPDLAKLGLLWLDQGSWDGRQLVPRDYLVEAQSTLVDTGGSVPTGYGFQQWTTTADGHPAFVALGRAGQVIEVVPAARAVVVIQSETQPWEPTEPGVAEVNSYLSLIGALIIPALN